MPPFDFPATPAVGEVSNGYQWTGEMWSGAPKLGSDVSEQFFDVSGLNNIDIPVPAWAKACEIRGSVFNTDGTIYLRVSYDGSTFLAGATDYNNSAAYHNTGSSGYASGTPVQSNAIFLAGAGNLSATVAVDFQTQMRLVRPTTAEAFEAVSYSKNADGGAATGHRTYWYYGWPSTASGTTAIKALRLMPGAGAFTKSPSWVKVKWLGDIAQIPPSNGIADAPSDGCEYVRVNNIWRKKSQTFVLDGLVNFDLVVPDNAKAVRIYSSLMHATAQASGSVSMRASGDGTTFPAGATDYHYAGFIQYSGSAGFASLSSALTNQAYITFNNDSNIVQDVFDLRMSLVRPTVPSNQPWYGICNSISYQSAAANAYNAVQTRIGVMNTSFPQTVLKTLRFFIFNGTAYGSPSMLEASWIY